MDSQYEGYSVFAQNTASPPNEISPINGSVLPKNLPGTSLREGIPASSRSMSSSKLAIGVRAVFHQFANSLDTYTRSGSIAAITITAIPNQMTECIVSQLLIISNRTPRRRHSA